MTDGSTVTYDTDQLSGIINSRFAVSNEQCNTGITSSQAISLIESNSNGFLGVYEPDPDYITSQLDANTQVNFVTISALLFFLCNTCFNMENSEKSLIL